MEAIDSKMVDGLRNFLFGPPGSGIGLDLAMLNIHRCRDHGLPRYSSMRQLFDGVSKIGNTKQTNLLTIYPDYEDIDLWVGLLSEDPLPSKAIGPSIHDILAMQFISLRDGDRFYYLNDP